jgi:hypothetical protein
MAQVNSENSTSMPVVQSRRRFLSHTAGVAAGRTVLALATIPPGAALTAPAGALDPVFALIEAHKETEAALAVACIEKGRLEDLGDWDADGGTEAAHEAEWSALANMLECVPATVAGVIASLTYMRGLVEEGYGRIEDDLVAVFLANLAEALSGAAS